MKNRTLPILALLIPVMSAPLAEAALIDSNDPLLTNYQSADGNNITTDTATGLDWLDIDTTVNLHFNAMTALLGVGELAAFRHATLTEVDTFFNNLGLPTFPLPGAFSFLDPGTAAITFAGGHTGFTSGVAALGLTSTLSPPNARRTAGFDSLGGGLSSTGSGTLGIKTIPKTGGNWVVRPTVESQVVPEPGSFTLFAIGAGMLGLGGWFRRRRKQTLSNR